MKNYEWMILEMVLSRKKQLSYALLARVRDYVIILLLKLHLFCSTREKICIIMTTCCLKFQISNQTSEKMQFEFELSEGFPVQTGLTRKSCWKFSVMLILNFLEKQILNFSDRWQLLSAARCTFEHSMSFSQLVSNFRILSNGTYLSSNWIQDQLFSFEWEFFAKYPHELKYSR